MVMYPDVQKTAQEEIDRVVGHERLPTYEDLDNLPYVGAVLKESLRCVSAGLLNIQDM